MSDEWVSDTFDFDSGTSMSNWYTQLGQGFTMKGGKAVPHKPSPMVWHCGVCGHEATFPAGETVEFGDPRFCEHGPRPVTYPDGTHVYGQHTPESNYGHYFPTGDEPECLRGCGVTNAELAARLGYPNKEPEKQQ